MEVTNWLVNIAAWLALPVFVAVGEWNPTRQCTGTNRQGGRCRRQPIAGGNVCVMHGGAAPQTQEAARRKLLAGADLAIEYMLAMLEPKPPCETCGRSDADRDPVVLRACQLVLDRSGFHPTIAVQQAEPEDTRWMQFMPSERLEQMSAWIEDAKRRMSGLPVDEPLQLPAAIDAYIVEEDDEETPIPEPASDIPVAIHTPEPGIAEQVLTSEQVTSNE